jgi:hypothetical protein
MLNKHNATKSALTLVLAASVAIATGCGGGGGGNVKIDGVIGPKVNFIDGKFTLSTILKDVSFDGGVRLQIPKLPNSYLEVGPDFQSNGTLIAIGIDTVDLKALVGGGLNLLDPHGLPGGRPLPGVLAGELPSIAVEVEKLSDLVFYFGPTVFGVFVPVKLGIKDSILSFRFNADNGQRVGNISVVGKDGNGKNSGFLLLINMQEKMIKNLLAKH